MSLHQRFLQALVEDNKLIGLYFNPQENCLYTDRQCTKLALILTLCITLEVVLNWGFTIITPAELITRKTISEKADRNGNLKGFARTKFH